MIKLLTASLLAAASLTGQAVPICMAVTEENARTALGPNAKRTKDPSGCGWTDGKRELSVTLIGVASMFERARAGTAAQGETKDEMGLGGKAFSTIPSAHHGGRAAIYLLKGSTVLVVDLHSFADGAAVERLPQMRDLVRILAPKL